jgi:hypothetical protein
MPRSALKHLIQVELERQAPIIFNKLMVENCLASSDVQESKEESKDPVEVV